MNNQTDFLSLVQDAPVAPIEEFVLNSFEGATAYHSKGYSWRWCADEIADIRASIVKQSGAVEKDAAAFASRMNLPLEQVLALLADNERAVNRELALVDQTAALVSIQVKYEHPDVPYAPDTPMPKNVAKRIAGLAQRRLDAHKAQTVRLG